MKKKTVRQRRTSWMEAMEMRKIVRAQRAYHADLIERFSAKLLEADAKVKAAEEERAKLLLKHAEAPGKIVECDEVLRRLALISRNEPSTAAEDKAKRAGKRLTKMQAKLLELAEDMTPEEIETLIQSLK